MSKLSRTSVKRRVDMLLEASDSILTEGAFIDDSFNIFISRDIEDIVNELNTNGVTIDEDKLRKHLDEYSAKETKAINDFNSAVTKLGYSVNISKRKEIIDLFYTKLGLPIYKSTKTGPSIDSECLEVLRKLNPIPGYYADAKSARSMINTLTNILNALKSGKIYPQHNLNKAASGRFSSGGVDKININGWSKDIRDILKAADAKVIVSFDYKNMEGAVSASMAGQTDLIEDMANDVDLHQQLADILGVDRKVAKIVNHGCSYGMTAFGLGRKIGCSEEEAQDFIDAYWNKRSKIRNLKQDVIHTAKMMGYIATISGFKRNTNMLSDDQIWSTFIQGSAADLFKQALVEVQTYFKKNGNGKVLTPMHDALICEIDSENLDETIAAVKDIMENIHEKFTLRVDVQIGKW